MAFTVFGFWAFAAAGNGFILFFAEVLRRRNMIRRGGREYPCREVCGEAQKKRDAR